jgi:hypothetical protein
MATRQAKQEEAPKQEVAVREAAAVPMVMDLMADAADTGFENADAQCFAIPFLYILQSNSPQCKRSEGAYIKGCEESMLFNTVTEQFFDGEFRGCDVVPVAFARTFTEWIPKDAGGGFQGEHDPVTGERMLATCTRNEKGHDMLPNGHQLVDTRKHYVLYRPSEQRDPKTEEIIAEAGPWKPAIISMSSTQTKKSKKWLTIASDILIPGTEIAAPMYSQIYHITTVPESNEKGSWYGWKIDHVSQITDGGLYAKAKSFRELIRTGKAVDAEPMDIGASTVSEAY